MIKESDQADLQKVLVRLSSEYPEFNQLLSTLDAAAFRAGIDTLSKVAGIVPPGDQETRQAAEALRDRATAAGIGCYVRQTHLSQKGFFVIRLSDYSRVLDV